MANDISLKCTSCGSAELCFGNLGTGTNSFIPSGVFTVYGFRIRSYVCLECGLVHHYIPKDKLQRLRQRFHTQYQ